MLDTFAKIIFYGLLGFFLYKFILKYLFWGIKSDAKALKTMVTRKGAFDVFDMLEESAVNGEVPDEAIDAAFLKMAASGASSDEILNYVLSVNRGIRFNEDVARRKIANAQRDIHYLSQDQIYAMAHGNLDTAMAIQMEIDSQKRKVFSQEEKLNKH